MAAAVITFKYQNSAIAIFPIKKIPKIKGCHGQGVGEKTTKGLGEFFQAMELFYIFIVVAIT